MHEISDVLKNNYRDYYKDGDSEWRRLCAVAKANNITALCSNLPRSSVLEIGAGEGSILKTLSELKFADRLYALEISSSGVETIKKKNIPELVEYKIFDGSHVPYEDKSFDIAIMSHVLEHAEFPRQLLYEASRVAEYIFVEVPLEDTVRLPRDFILDAVGHINFFSPKTLRQLVQSCNLEIIDQITTNIPKGAYIFQKGRKGLITFYVKEALIRIAPRIATEIYTYHGALVCRSNARK